MNLKDAFLSLDNYFSARTIGDDLIPYLDTGHN